MAISTDLTSVGDTLNSLSSQAGNLTNDASGIVNSVNSLVDSGLTKGLSDLQSAFIPKIEIAIPSITLPSIPGIDFSAPSITNISISRKTILNKISEFQSVVPTLPKSLNSIRDSIPSIQASSLMGGLNDLKNLTGGLSNIPNSLTNAAGDLAADLTSDIAGGITSSIGEYGNIPNMVGSIGTTLSTAGISLGDLTGGLTSLVDKMPGLPTGMSLDSLKGALSFIPAIPISIPEIDIDPKKYVASIVSYTYKSLL
jgi:hypothetical protein